MHVHLHLVCVAIHGLALKKSCTYLSMTLRDKIASFVLGKCILKQNLMGLKQEQFFTGSDVNWCVGQWHPLETSLNRRSEFELSTKVRTTSIARAHRVRAFICLRA